MPDITVEQLAMALEFFRLDVLDRGLRINGKVADPDEVARALHATLGRMTALREDRGALPEVNPGNAVDDALERCRAALSWCSPENRERVVSALVGDVIKTGPPRLADEPLPMPPAPHPDPELAAIGAIMAALAALDDADAVERVIAYVAHRCNVPV